MNQQVFLLQTIQRMLHPFIHRSQLQRAVALHNIGTAILLKGMGQKSSCLGIGHDKMNHTASLVCDVLHVVTSLINDNERLQLIFLLRR